MITGHRKKGTVLKYLEATLGRIFILRLEQGEKIPAIIQDFAEKHQINSALVHFLGGADKGSKVVVGPEDGQVLKPRKMMTELQGTSETLGVGTLFRNEQGKPVLHMHAAFGREGKTVAGCVREGVDIWQIGEVVMIELNTSEGSRKIDPTTDFELLEIE
jgi:predicted DNA-binding protein with PD1-like motif